MKQTVYWRGFTRDALPSALFGLTQRSQSERALIDPLNVPADYIAVGYKDEPLFNGYAPPSLLLIDHKMAVEIFSWLNVYAPQTSPLSQFARVVGRSDLEILEALDTDARVLHGRSDQWACMALGEILAQGDADVELNTIPVSRASACFSTAMGRTAMIYRSEKALRLCAQRLEQLELEARFARRPVSVDELMLGWSLLRPDSHVWTSIKEPPVYLISEVQDYCRKRFGKTSFEVSLDAYVGLFSDSVEERVVTFNRMITEHYAAPIQASSKYLASALLGVAAFLVGRGTSHVFLLRSHAKFLPSAYAWFAVVAAMAGPTSWDAHWSRLTKSIERGIRARFEWSDPPTADLCWSEFAWMANSFRGGPEIFADLPKAFPRVLSIEVVPGSSCQFRLAQSSSTNADPDTSQVQSPINKELQALLLQVAGLATKARGLLDMNYQPPAPVQQSFDLKDEPVYKNARPKKGKST